MKTRGIVVNSIYYKKQSGFELKGGIEPIDIRRYALYWDSIDYPYFNGMSPNMNVLPELRLLKEEGILLQSYTAIRDNEIKVISEDEYNSKRHTLNLSDFEALINNLKESQIKVANDRNNKGAMIWSIAQIGEDLKFPTEIKQEKDSLEILLYNCLPIPDVNVNLHDVLNFKSKREAELLRLRNALDKLYTRLIIAEELSKEYVKIKEEIELSLLDLHRVLDETKIQKIISNTKVYLDLKDSSTINILLPLVGALGANELQLPKELGALSGLGINAFINVFKKKIPKVDKLPERLKDYVYLYEIEKKLL